MTRTLLWDWDDVLVDLPEIQEAAARRISPGALPRDYPLPHEWNDVMRYWCGVGGGEEVMRREIEGMFRQFLPIRPGVREVLRDLRGHTSLLAGSLWRSTLDLYLGQAGWSGYFDVVRGGDEASRGKPDPELYLRVLDQAGTGEDEAVAIVGSASGAEAARRANIEFILLPGEMPAARGALGVAWQVEDIPRLLLS